MSDMRPSEAMRIMENPEDYTVQERKDAKRVLMEYGPKTSKDKTGGLRKATMMRGGMANKKEHMYAAGGSVMDNLTAGQKRMVRAMAADNKK